MEEKELNMLNRREVFGSLAGLPLLSIVGDGSNSKNLPVLQFDRRRMRPDELEIVLQEYDDPIVGLTKQGSIKVWVNHNTPVLIQMWEDQNADYGLHFCSGEMLLNKIIMMDITSYRLDITPKTNVVAGSYNCLQHGSLEAENVSD